MSATSSAIYVSGRGRKEKRGTHCSNSSLRHGSLDHQPQFLLLLLLIPYLLPLILTLDNALWPKRQAATLRIAVPNLLLARQTALPPAAGIPTSQGCAAPPVSHSGDEAFHVAGGAADGFNELRTSRGSANWRRKQGREQDDARTFARQRQNDQEHDHRNEQNRQMRPSGPREDLGRRVANASDGCIRAEWTAEYLLASGGASSKLEGACKRLLNGLVVVRPIGRRKVTFEGKELDGRRAGRCWRRRA